MISEPRGREVQIPPSRQDQSPDLQLREWKAAPENHPCLLNACLRRIVAVQGGMSWATRQPRARSYRRPSKAPSLLVIARGPNVALPYAQVGIPGVARTASATISELRKRALLEIECRYLLSSTWRSVSRVA